MKIIDVSWPLFEGMATYPHNPAYRVDRSADTSVSELCMGTHAGTHVDAPLHAFEDGASVDATNLHALIGDCRVLDMTHIALGEGIGEKDFAEHNIQTGERIIVKTKNSELPEDVFPDAYVYIASDAATYLATQRIALCGIDHLSVKKQGSNDNTPHTALLNAGVTIVEGLRLSSVEPGVYTLMCLPLKLIDVDGAPARAVLTQV